MGCLFICIQFYLFYYILLNQVNHVKIDPAIIRQVIKQIFQHSQIIIKIIKTMLASHFTILNRNLVKVVKFGTSKAKKSYNVLDIKNSHLVYVKDTSSSLPYMSEIITDQGHKGVIIKLEQNATAVIGMYQNVDPCQEVNIVGWNPIKIQDKFVPNFNNIYDIDCQSVGVVKDIQPNRNLSCKLKKQSKRSRIQTLNPFLALSHDIFVGDLVAFTGPLGSGRTKNAIQAIECFTNSDITEPVGIYLNTNPNDFKQKCGLAAQKYRTFSFGRTPTDLQSGASAKNTIPSMSSVGVYMLAVKCIKLANKLKNQGKNVMFVVDNIHEILANQWTVLQSLKLPISPFNILNQLYASSSQGQLGRRQDKNTKPGSLTTIAITSPQAQDVIQEYTTFGNNTKYLRTLCPQIAHPVQLTVNGNHVKSCKILDSMRGKVNKLLREKKQKQLLTKLKLTRDQPWQHYYILDSQWWVQALKNYKPKSLTDRDLLFWFINTNIEEDYIAHWRIGSIQAYNRYLDYLARPEDLTIGMDIHQLENFIELCKSEETFDVFKKDYLN